MKIVLFFGLVLMYTTITTISFLLVEGYFKYKVITSFVISLFMTCLIGVIIGMSLLIDM